MEPGNTLTFPKLYFLCDCNNFFVSCERIFRPDLDNKPVLVLSNNDGCVIARSPEVKKLGIPMGIAVFKIQDLIKQHQITCFSSNFNLYLDISSRVMRTLESLVPEIEIYSVDEAFLTVRKITQPQALDLAFRIKHTLASHVGIPVSIGIATSRTLSKLASHLAKSEPALAGVCNLVDSDLCDAVLAKTEVGEIWGIGKRLKEHLNDLQIFTAKGLRNADPKMIRQKFSLPVANTVRELRGEDVITDVISHDQKQIMWSRSFKPRLVKKDELEAALAAFTAECAVKLRAIGKYCRKITIFYRTPPFAEGIGYSVTESLTFDIPEQDTRILTKAALKLLEKTFKAGCSYGKAGIILSDLCQSRESQSSLFTADDDKFDHHLKNSQTLMAAVDSLNLQKRNTIFWGRSGFFAKDPKHQAKKMLSPSYTTDFNSLPLLK